MDRDLVIELPLSSIGQGCMGIGGEFVSDPTLSSEHIKSIRVGIDEGLTFLDTAEVYADGLSEELVGLAVHGRRPDVFLASKFSPANNGFRQVIAAAERTLRRLNTDYLDLYQVHWPNPSVPIAETMAAMNKLVTDGKILHIGVSNFSVREMSEAAANSTVRIFSNQVEYNLHDRFCELEMLPFCQQIGAFLVAYSPLNKGKGIVDQEQRKLVEDIALNYNATAEQVQLSWLRARPGVIPIPKSSNPERIRQNAGALALSLSPADQDSVDQHCRAPVHMIAPAEVEVSTSGDGNRPVYQTLAEALQNDLMLTPSPSSLAVHLKEGDPIKPVRLRINRRSLSSQQYELVEGRLRYWAWVIAFGENHPLPALISRDSER